jgi:capsular polysaccharide transport system ATP-binding protein
MIICQNIVKTYRAGHGRHKVLKGINLTIHEGEKIALLGRNGAGKSTLIKQVGGVELPDRGRIIRKMTNGWPIGFNGGFQGSLTGYDNARFIARIYGSRLDDIKAFVEDFSELGVALKRPVQTYSSGMRARLAFALSLAIEFDCYLIDEVILVGDQNFQRKCFEELFDKRADRAMLIASHDMTTVASICDRAILIEDGLAHEFDSVADAVVAYEALK